MAEERAQRRLAAVLAADVVGYSRLMEEDESGTLAALKARRKQVLEPLVTRHRGRLFKVAGDGALIEFGARPRRDVVGLDRRRAADLSLDAERPLIAVRDLEVGGGQL